MSNNNKISSPAKSKKGVSYNGSLIYVTAMRENPIIDKLFRNMSKDYKVTWGNKMFEKWVESFNLIRFAYEATDNESKCKMLNKLYYAYRTIETYIKYGIDCGTFPIGVGERFMFSLGNLMAQSKNWLNSINKNIDTMK